MSHRNRCPGRLPIPYNPAMQHVDFTATCFCAWCGESMVVAVDPSAGPEQEYVEDCQVCCSPNVLTVRFRDDGTADVVTRPE